MFTAGFTFVGAFRIDCSFHAGNLDCLQASPSKPDLYDASRRETNTQIVAGFSDPLRAKPAEGFFGLAHEFQGRDRNDDVSLIGLSFGQ